MRDRRRRGSRLRSVLVFIAMRSAHGLVLRGAHVLRLAAPRARLHGALVTMQQRAGAASQMSTSTMAPPPQFSAPAAVPDDEPPPPLMPDEPSASSAPSTPETLVHEVLDVAAARDVARILHNNNGLVHACDTEVAELDLKKSPVGQGRVICVSVYSGPDIDFGSGPGRALWIDTTVPGVLDELKSWLERADSRKVWHNYGFDRHVLGNHGVNVQGFGGDTMHMARLWDAARKTTGGYSLEALTEELVGRKKVPMKEIFGVPKLMKSGKPGKLIELPPVDQLQADLLTRPEWIQYSCYDAQGTWLLHEELRKRLQAMEWQRGESLYSFYKRYWRPFGECLTEMEKEGIWVDKGERLPKAQELAEAQREESISTFRKWAASFCDDAWYMNPGSAAQVQTLLFGGARKKGRGNAGEVLPLQRTFKVERTEWEELHAARLVEEDGMEPEAAAAAAHALAWGTEDGEEEVGADGKVKKKKKPGKWVEIELRSLELPHTKETKTGGAPAVDAESLRELAGAPSDDPPVYGKAHAHFAGGAEGVAACRALEALCQMGAIDTMISNFIVPLQENADDNSRIHCSLNLNTETGRLSSRAPNLQNQPALDKDQYFIRKAFCAEPGNALVVADYGQLELRLLAHIAGCKSMIDAFASGGDFHTRTAIGMFPYIREAIESGEITFDEAKGKYGTERRRAKVLNFSIAYGKTVYGLSKDWGISKAEAQDMVDRWYGDRPEVRAWQAETIKTAHKEGHTRTLMGRYRLLPGINGSPAMRAHSERAAINTPIQGGAADIMTLAMLKIANTPRLKELGYRLLLQIHDEVILEGPEEHAAAAREEVMRCMEQPFDDALPGMLVDLVVDCKVASNWYDAK